jgi:adenosylcobinamide hydrolase
MLKLFQNASWPLTWEQNPERVVIESERPLAVLSSAVYGGEKKTARRLINRHVPLSYLTPDPGREIEDWLVQANIVPEETVVLLTAADVDCGCLRVIEEETFRLAVFVTAGVSNAARAGQSYPVFWHAPSRQPGTINLIIVIDGKMTEAAMVNAVITATEAKAAALQDLHIKDANGRQATGTTTDAIIIAATQTALAGYTHAYAGVTTPLGNAIGQAVYHSVREVVARSRR